MTTLVQKIKNTFQQDNIIKQFLELMPDSKNKEQVLRTEISSLLLDISQEEKLQQCTIESILRCLRKTLSLGLRIGKAHKEAYIIAGKSQVGGQYIQEAQIRTGYPAYINIGYRDYGLLFTTEVVCAEEIEKGLFQYDHATQTISHAWSPDLQTTIKTKDNIRFVYVIVKSTNDDKFIKHSRPYTVDELQERAKQKRNIKGGGHEYYFGNVWNSKDRTTDFAEMLKKTALIAFCKALPQKTLRELADLEINIPNTEQPSSDNIKEVNVIPVIDEQQVQELRAIAEELKCEEELLNGYSIQSLDQLPADKYEEVRKVLSNRMDKCLQASQEV